MQTQATLTQVSARALVAVQATLERGGWILLAADIDLTRETVRMELVDANGLLVTFDARNGAATCTRERRTFQRVAVGRRGDVSIAHRMHYSFVGRESFDGARSGMRWLAQYLADNSGNRLSLSDSKSALRLTMDGQRHLLASR